MCIFSENKYKLKLGFFYSEFFQPDKLYFFEIKNIHGMMSFMSLEFVDLKYSFSKFFYTGTT